ncbi:hypothetical protein EPA93_22845 [Ktedonosporobacter rubrisoli]|uniref:CRISPR type III-associated protein domain-containing protein n=1 Tax=Ktedonosporobacter rubrisoli TaxID=2509675 RepID=A0A4P6JSY0_KTERU|nr:RAMP superfamily CRISPR-associated protein [Ktedonosporobacter rubrisoli]QBD78669.1 hypothetical protein EPA93_22845 [Ktedonosporobacter rubrisoli]
MKKIYIRLDTLSPLTVRADHAHDGAETAHYIPGTALMGSLAALHRALRGTDEEQFRRFFLNGEIYYPYLYPAVFKDDGLHGQDSPVYPLPKTAQSCKRHPGFRPTSGTKKDEDEETHGVRDSLLDRFLFTYGHDKLGREGLLATLREHRRCKGDPEKQRPCQEPMDRLEGYYRRNLLDLKEAQTAQVKKYLYLHTYTGIHRASGTVQDGILYNRQVFKDGMRFWGMVQLADEQLGKDFKKFLQDANASGMMHIGTGRTRGMGKVWVDFDDYEKETYSEKIEKRLDELNNCFQTHVKTYGFKELETRYFFALTLHSPLILANDSLSYRGSLDEQTVADLLGNRARAWSDEEAKQRLCKKLEELRAHLEDYSKSLKLEYYAASIRRITGWQDLWGMPRTNELAIDTGSVFLFSLPAPALDADILRALYQLEAQGAGKRRAEGFGRICVSDAFHQKVDVL